MTSQWNKLHKHINIWQNQYSSTVQCKPKGILFSPSVQVEAKIVDEEYEDGRCSARPCKASLRDSDSPVLCVQRSLSAGSRKDVSTPYYESHVVTISRLVHFYFIIMSNFFICFWIRSHKTGLTSNYGDHHHFRNCKSAK